MGVWKRSFDLGSFGQVCFEHWSRRVASQHRKKSQSLRWLQSWSWPSNQRSLALKAKHDAVVWCQSWSADWIFVLTARRSWRRYNPWGLHASWLPSPMLWGTRWELLQSVLPCCFLKRRESPIHWSGVLWNVWKMQSMKCVKDAACHLQIDQSWLTLKANRNSSELGRFFVNFSMQLLSCLSIIWTILLIYIYICTLFLA